MLRLISAYWGRPSGRIVECFVVQDLDNWPQASCRRAHARRGGNNDQRIATINGKADRRQGDGLRRADRGTPQLGNYWRVNDSSVEIEQGVLEYLQKSEPKSLNEIVNESRSPATVALTPAWDTAGELPRDRQPLPVYTGAGSLQSGFETF